MKYQDSNSNQEILSWLAFESKTWFLVHLYVGTVVWVLAHICMFCMVPLTHFSKGLLHGHDTDLNLVS